MNRFASISYYKQTISNKLDDFCVRGKLDLRRIAEMNKNKLQTLEIKSKMAKHIMVWDFKFNTFWS